MHNFFFSNLGSRNYNDAEKAEIFTLISFAQTLFDAQITSFTDVQKLNHIFGQFNSKYKAWIAEGNLKDPFLRQNYDRFIQKLFNSLKIPQNITDLRQRVYYFK